MSKAMSGILSQYESYWSEYSDSHEAIKQEFKLCAKENLAGSRHNNLLPYEITPPNNDYSLPLDQWQFSVELDADFLPSWYDPIKDEERARQALKAWAKEKLKVRVEQRYQNLGKYNTGNQNTGNKNTGRRNTGDWNTGDWNTGDWNTGDWNTGDCNTGHTNKGSLNTGSYNTGHKNTGDWNNTNHSTGIFCTTEQNILIFDSPTNMKYSEWIKSDAACLLHNLVLTIWVEKSEMTQEEIDTHPEAHYLDGYLKSFTFQEAYANMWNGFTAEEKQIIKAIPNFNPIKFQAITGINSTKEEDK